MHKGFIRTSAVFGFLSVALGAFAAHTLRQKISDYAVNIFETGVRYQFYHTFALLAVGVLYKECRNKLMLWAGILFIIGVFLFCGSLYFLMCVKGMVIPGYDWVGAITPIGGLLFLAGWACMLAGVSVKGSVPYKV